MKGQRAYKRFEGLLQELRKSFELSVTEEVKETEGDFERYLIFLLGTEAFALPITQLREVLSEREVIPVPYSPPSVHGVINCRNRILSVTNIHNLLQIMFKKKDAPFLLVTRSSKFEKALLVDGLIGLVAINQSEIKPKVSGQNESVDRLITGEIYHQEKLVTLLDLMEVG
ncbi:MAG: chemotaxis protein CheW [Thermodesulfobacteriota bacterium]|nr:chemotaxis protein CheW [Thermodesulfobacteriota bacterium]